MIRLYLWAVTGLVGCGVIYGQVAALPQFEVATVKSSPPAGGDRININLGNVRNGKLTFANASLSDCLKFAYGIVSDDQIAGPDWIKSKETRFDIVAQVAPDTPRESIMLMLQALLAERLELALHHEQKTIQYLALMSGKNGPTLTEAKPGAVAANSAMRGRIAGNQISMQLLATLLSRFERVTVVDETGIKGQFELKLDWTPDDAAGVPITDIVADVGAPSIFTALQRQLGLKLESRKGPLDVLVIDRAEKIPAEN